MAEARVWFTSAAPRLHFSPLPSQLARIELAAMGNVDQHQDGLPRRAPSAHGCVNTARGQPTYPGAANAWARLWRDGQADPGEYLITEGIVCHSLAISSLAVASTTPRICASGFVHSRIAALRSRSTSACFSHRPSDAHLLLSVARHDLLARAQLFFVFGFDHPRGSANSLNTKLLSAWESPARSAGGAMPTKNPRRRGLRRLGPGPHRRRDFWLGGGRAHRGCRRWMPRGHSPSRHTYARSGRGRRSCAS